MNNWQVLVGGIAIGVGLLGCGKGQVEKVPAGDTHNHAAHAEPESLTEAVTLIKQSRDELAAAYADANRGEADAAFHEIISHVKAAKNLIDTSGMDRYEADDAVKACDSLLEALDPVHPPHDSAATIDPADYEGAKEAIDTAITNLETAISQGTGGSVAE